MKLRVVCMRINLFLCREQYYCLFKETTSAFAGVFTDRSNFAWLRGIGD